MRTEFLRKSLDGKIALEARIASPVNLAHATGAEALKNFVAAEAATRRQRGQFEIGCRRRAHEPLTSAARQADRQSRNRNRMLICCHPKARQRPKDDEVIISQILKGIHGYSIVAASAERPLPAGAFQL